MTDDSRDKQPKGRKAGENSGKTGENSGNGIGLDSETRQHLARMLKATYDEVASQPTPDWAKDLLDRLDAAESREK